jgi:hypothetical protein
MIGGQRMRPLSRIVVAVFILGTDPAVFAEDRVAIKTILDRPAEYQAKVVTVEGTAKGITNIPVHRGAHRCGGRPLYDTQKFVLEDESGTIGIGTTGTCQPGATQPVHEKESLRIRGVVVADEKDPKGTPAIYADAIDRITPSR